MVCIDSFKLQTMTAFNQKLLQGVRMLHGACFTFSRKEPREASGRRRQKKENP
jgi:hypothetical protein